MGLNFPPINFEYWLSKWQSNQNKEAYFLPQMTNYSQIKKGITDLECEEEILTLVKKIQDPIQEKEAVLRVIDLIYRWGGRSGRMFYLQNQDKNKMPRKELAENQDLFHRYCDAIDLAKNGKASSKFLFQTIPGIGSSFASKHATFWSAYSRSPLIVIDSKIVGCFGIEKLEKFDLNYSYESVINEFNEFGKSLTPSLTSQQVERALFTFHLHFFNNENSGWTNKDVIELKNSEDFDIAAQIAEKLKFS
jgi:hypothetical protein